MRGEKKTNGGQNQAELTFLFFLASAGENTKAKSSTATSNTNKRRFL